MPLSAKPTWPGLLSALLRREELSSDDTAWAMEQILLGEATPAQLAGFVIGLRSKGESPAEVDGFVRTMLAHARRIDVPGPTVDTCGTGGDRANTVNISTMAAIVVAATGARVVKHGNRAASSACGSADLLEALGVVADLDPLLVPECVERCGIAFCFAPRFHPALRHAAAPRRELGVATVFNFLGPLANPAQPEHQAVGVADERMAEVMAHVLARRGSTALVFRGEDGLDELTTTAPSRVWVVSDGAVHPAKVAPEELGLERVDATVLRGSDAAFNAAVARDVLAGATGPVRDAVLLNAAAALVALDLTEAPIADQLVAGMRRAAAAVDDGASAQLLDRWAATTRELTAP
jgi:anthranilate phosphoribosyltransferase